LFLLPYLLSLIKKQICYNACLLLASVLLFSVTNSKAQEQDTTTIRANTLKHNPRKAVFYSMIVPGLGQVYNHKYWKVPIIYGAGGAFAYFVNFNQVKYKKFRDAYVNGSPNQQVLIDGQYYNYDILPRGRDYYRRYRDLSVLGFGAIYLLNIIDAMVDAHFYFYDVGNDLTMRIDPVVFDNFGITSAIGLRINIGF
jgi:hypothetical protein